MSAVAVLAAVFSENQSYSEGLFFNLKSLGLVLN